MIFQSHILEKEKKKKKKKRKKQRKEKESQKGKEILRLCVSSLASFMVYLIIHYPSTQNLFTFLIFVLLDITSIFNSLIGKVKLCGAIENE